MGCLRAFVGPWVNDFGPLGFGVLFMALASPILLGLGGGMLGVHRPHTLVASEGTLFAVNMDFFDTNIVLPETYSYCVYSFTGVCGDGALVNVTARRDDVAYNGLKKVTPTRCFADVEKLNDAGAHETWSDECVPDSTGVACSGPRPVIRAWYQQGSCDSGRLFSWTLNDPAETLPRFLAILIAGGVATLCGLVPMIGLWLCKGCETEGDDYV